MQVANANPEIKVTGRHVAVTDAIVDYARKKVDNLHLDYPRIIEAQIILDVEKYRHIAEVVLRCNNHITNEAEPLVVRTEKYPVKPMFVDEAVLQLQMNAAQQFVVFLNAKSEKVNVLYRRKQGNFGVIEPAFA